MGNNILTKELLLKSVEEWNEARRENPNLRADLSGADLSGAKLAKANLNNADLSNANLNKSDLSRANLGSASLAFASLKSAYLQSASFIMANLLEADLSGADLGNSNLVGAVLLNANLSRANLHNANLTGVIVGYTIFAAVDLSNAKSLESIRHNGPSTIGIDTLFNSKGEIPEVFLRGCGVPDNFIEYVRSLTAKPIEYYSCFISYSHKNEEFAQRLHTDLQANNVRCWFAPHDLPIGAKTRPAIDDAIRIHDKLLLILSENSVQSNWVEHEVEHALDLETERGKLVLFPVRLDDDVMDSKTGWASNVKRQRNIGDFTKWKDHDAYQEAFKRLLRDLKQSEKPKK